jgi:hypothetical protein
MFTTEDGPAYDAVAVTPSDTTDLHNVRALYIGTTGDIAIVTIGGASVTFANVPVGFFPVRCTKVKSTGTTATDIVALY